MAKQRTVRFIELLGSGGFGEVYLVDVADEQQFVQRMALKLMRQDVEEERFFSRLRDEARLLAKLNHDNIVKVHGLGTLMNRPAIFMEHVPGIDLDTLLQVDTIPLRTALEMTATAARALHAAHTAISPQSGEPLSVIHRDIKPANMLLTQYGSLKILDFGIAKADFDRESTTRSFRMGTPRYMAPERWTNVALTNRVDVYSLGVALFEMLMHSPMSRTGNDPARHQALLDSSCLSLSKLNVPTPVLNALERVLKSALAFSAINRPTAEELSDALFDLTKRVSGDEVRVYAALTVPKLIEARHKRFAQRPLPEEGTLDFILPERLASDIEPDQGAFSEPHLSIEDDKTEDEDSSRADLVEPIEAFDPLSFVTESDSVDVQSIPPIPPDLSAVFIQWVACVLTILIVGPVVFYFWG